MKTILPIFFLLSVGLTAIAADTKPVVNRDGNCAVSVPADWSVEAALGMAKSPDKKVSVVVSSPKSGMVSMNQVEETAPTIYKDDKVTKKSGSEFEMEGQSGNGKPNFYRAVPAGARVCIAEVQYESGEPADAKAIIQTLKAK
jgi:hypothetical protein